MNREACHAETTLPPAEAVSGEGVRGTPPDPTGPAAGLFSIERALAGAILLDPERVLPLCAGLTLGMLHDDHVAAVLDAARALVARGRHVDGLVVAEALEGRPGPVEGWAGWISDAISDCPCPSHAPDYIHEIMTGFRRRRLALLGRELAGATSEEQIADALAAIREAEADMGEIGATIPSLSLTDYAEAAIDDSATLLGRRFLCREGAMLFVGPSGVGKSSASCQQDVLWSLGLPAFGIPAARPLKICTIQAENDDSDLTEMARGIMDGLQIEASDREAVRLHTRYFAERSKVGKDFIRFCEAVLKQEKPDLLRIDPLQSYLGGDPSDPEVVSAFVHVGLNPILKQYGCACIINHHTTKTNNRDTSKWKASDWQYSGAGSAVLTNWARAILVVDPCEADPQLFRFIAAKRGYRIGWTRQDGERETERYFAHAREGTRIYWSDATPDAVAAGTRPSKSKLDVMPLVPDDEPILKDTLLHEVCRVLEIGEKKAARFLNELVSEGKLHVWKTPRPRTNPRIDLCRHPQSEKAGKA